MEQAAEKTIRQLSAAIEQGLQPSSQHSEAIINMDLLNSDPQTQNGLSVYDSGSLSIQDPVRGYNTGSIGSVVDLALGPKKSDPIWRLKLLATINLVVIAMIGVFVLPGYFQGVHTTYRMVMLVTIVGVPIVVVVISLFVSFWLASDRQNNLITGLLVANVSILVGGALALPLALPLYFVLNGEPETEYRVGLMDFGPIFRSTHFKIRAHRSNNRLKTHRSYTFLETKKLRKLLK